MEKTIPKILSQYTGVPEERILKFLEKHNGIPPKGPGSRSYPRILAREQGLNPARSQRTSVARRVRSLEWWRI